MPDEYHIQITGTARKSLRSLRPPLLDEIRTAIRSLAHEPRPPGVVKLSGVRGIDNRYRIRGRTHRIIFDIDDAEARVVVVRVDHRRDVYRS